MDENSALIEAILRGEDIMDINDETGWKKVSYAKRNRKQQTRAPASSADPQKIGASNTGDVFRSVEQHSEERLRRTLEAPKVAFSDELDNSTAKLNGEEAEEEIDGEASGVVEKKQKAKKPKKPKVSVADAAAKIDASDLATFLADITVSFDSQHDIQLMRFADYFGRSFASVSASQFPWMKTFKESSVSKLVDIPLSQISDAVYKTSVEWLNQRSFEALGSFVLWSLDGILADIPAHQGTVKGSKKVVQQPTPKSKVAIFVVLAMTLRRKPDVLISLLPIMSENPKYQGQDKLPVTVWLIAQACQGDLGVGLYMWAHFLLPMLSSKSTNNPQARDLILQLVERILSAPKARVILINGAVRKGERLVPPSALELLMRAAFPSSSAKVKATERFEAVYSTLKEVALAGSPGSKAMKQLTLQILQFSLKIAGEGISDLSNEASNLCIWCLTQNPDCYKLWENIYLDNLEASVIVLKKLSDEWKEHSAKFSTVETLKVAIKNFCQKNEKALAAGQDAARQSSFKDAEKYSKMILARLSRGHMCMKSMVFVSVALAFGAAILTKTGQSEDLKTLLADLNLPFTL